jgi:hypothetical protein
MPARRRPASSAGGLGFEGLQGRLFRATPEELAHAVQTLLADSRLGHEERLHVLASAFVIEALAPYWADGRTPDEAHEALTRTEADLARVVEVLAPILLGHITAREEATDAIASIEVMLGLRSDSSPS